MANPGTSSNTHSGSKRTNCARVCHAAIQLWPEILQELIAIKKPTNELLADVNSNPYLSTKLYKDERSLVQNVQTKGYGGFDISLIYKLIRNLSLIPPPTQGWDFRTAPTSTEITPGDDLERIRRIRNGKLFHRGDARVSKAELDDYFTEFKEIADRLEQYLKTPRGEFVKRFEETHTCVMDEATEQLELLRLETQREKESGLRKGTDCNQLLIETWKREDEEFIMTNGARLIQQKLEKNNVNVIIIKGTPNIGKSVTIKHFALFLQESEGYQIVYCTGPDDIIDNFKRSRLQVFTFDDLLGKYTLHPTDVNDWVKYRGNIETILGNGNTKILASVRSQVFEDDRFSKLDYLNYFSLDLFDKNMTSVEQKWKIIRQHNQEYYLAYENLRENKHAAIEINFFPLSLSVNYKGKDFLHFLTDPLEYYSRELDELMKEEDKTKIAGLFQLVVHNGIIDIDQFLDDNTDEEKRTNETISEIFGIDVHRKMVVIEHLQTLKNLYVRKENRQFKPLNDMMFDILVYYFGTKMQEMFIKCAHSKVISERTQLKTLGINMHSSEYIVIIEANHEEFYFHRLVSDIYNGKVWDSFGNSQMIESRRFRLKALKFFKALSHEEQKRLAHSRDATGQNKTALPLFIASFFNYQKIVEFLLKYPVTFPGTPEPYPPIFAACETDNSQLTKILLQHGSSVNDTNIIGITPLIAACQNGHKNIVKILVDHQADLEKADDNNWTPLMWACAMQNEEIVYYLISENANIETKCNIGCSPMMWCCIIGNLTLVQFIHLKNKASIDLANKKGKTPLMAACFFRRQKIVEFLLDNGANINHSDDDGWTTLMEACFDNDNGGWNEFLEIFDRKDPWKPLLKLVAELGKYCDDNVGYNEIVDVLLKKCADVDQTDNDGKTALMHACEGGYNRIIHILIERGADVNKKDNDCETPLIEACFCEDEDVVMPLMEAGNTKIKPIIDQLLTEGADANATNDDGWNPFVDACENGKIEIAAKFIEKIRDKSIYSKALKLALQNRHGAIIQLFKDVGKTNEELIEAFYLEEGSMDEESTEASEEDNMEKELIEACKMGDLTKVESLIDKCVDVNCRTENERTPLIEACRGNFIEIVNLLLEAEASVNEDDDRCMTPLYHACKYGSIYIVRMILTPLYGLKDVNACDDRGISPILIACQNGHRPIVKLLLDHYADINIANNAGITPLIAACSKGDKNMVQMLLDKQADVNKSDAYGDTPLMVASFFGHIDIVQMLCSKSTDIQVKDCQGYTCLTWAGKGKHRNVIDFLLQIMFTLPPPPIL